MRKLLLALLAAFSGFAVTGCGPDAQYCDSCEAAVTPSGPDGRARLVRGRCVVGGQEIDCGTAEHVKCPSCRR